MTQILKLFALGGNEVSPTGGWNAELGRFLVPDIAAQWKRTADTCNLLAEIIHSEPDDLHVVTHGNGPQVGNILLRAEYASAVLHTLPLDICGADSQGGMGYMLTQLAYSLQMLGVRKTVAETIMQVLIDRNDPDLSDPSKFIGPSYSKAEAESKEKEGYRLKLYKKDEKGDELWRRVVGSPVPLDIIEIDVIEANLRAGIIPIAVGGGGIPVYRVEPHLENGCEVYECNYGIRFERPHKKGAQPADVYTGIEAVVDKDLSTSLLGTRLLERARARGEELETELVILTNVDGAKKNYQKPDQQDLRHLTLKEAKAIEREGWFGAGSMAPKVRAAIRFLEGGGRKAIITEVARYHEAVAGAAGTTFEP